MSVAVSPSLAHSSSLIRRVYGARPFHTDGELLALGFAANGTLWSVEEPGLLRHWNANNLQQISWNLIEEPATLWAFSPAAQFVASASDEVSVWEVATGEIAAVLPQPSWVSAVAFRPDAAVLATGHDDHAVRLWDRVEDQLLREFKGHEAAVSAVAFSPDGQWLASASEDKVIQVWHVPTGKLHRTLLGHKDRIPALAWTADARRLISCGWDTTARVWDVESGEPIILLNAHQGQVLTMALDPTGKLLACADSSNAILLWDLATYRPVEVLREQQGEVKALAFSPDGEHLVSGGSERVIHWWSARHGTTAREPLDPLLARTRVATADGKHLYTLGAGTKLRQWDTETGKPGLEFLTPEELRSIAVSPDGKWVAASRAERPVKDPEDAERNTLGLWNTTTGRQIALLEGQKSPLTTLAFSPDSKLLASGGYQTTDVWLWQVPSGEPALIIPLAAECCAIETLAFHPKETLLAVSGIDWMATGGTDGYIAVWDWSTRQQVAVFAGGATGLAYHPTGTKLAVSTLVRTVRVFNTENQALERELRGHTDVVTCVVYSPDGGWVVSGSDDYTIRVWDPQTGKERAAIQLDSQVKALAFSPDGQHLFTGNANASCYQLDWKVFLGKE